jgi:diguanylate cyclase (GGDEF)-like protein
LEDSVLVVDDDENARDSLAAVLKGAGMQVFVAASADEAVTQQQLHHPAAIVVDQQLAEQTGVELALRLKQGDAETPILLLTGLASLEGVLGVVDQLDGLLVKPLVPQAFVQTVRSALARRALVAENQRLADRITRLQTEEVGDAPLTEPPNRTQFEDRLAKALTGAQRDYSSLAVLFVELDGWQSVNQEFGSRTAEQVFREVASRVLVARRRSDVVSRIASDKFAIMCTDVRTAPDATRIAGLVLDGVSRPVSTNGVEHWLRATIGIVLTDPSAPEDTAERVLENAELAMYCARDEGRSSLVFDKYMRDRVVSRYEIEHGLQSAMENGELTLVYQPVVDLRTSQVVGAEALLRWHRGEQGVVLPGDFLPAVSQAGLAESLGRWTLDRALADLAAWNEAGEFPPQGRLTINVSGREVTDPQYVDVFEELTKKHGVAASMVTLDLDEEAAHKAAADTGVLTRLAHMGVQFNLDDFGGWDVTLSWLQDLPITTLKVAPRFVAALDAPDRPHGAAMVRALITLGHELHLTMVAEGVETPGQAAAVRAIGCDLAQGYYLGHPGPAEEVWRRPEA